MRAIAAFAIAVMLAFFAMVIVQENVRNYAPVLVDYLDRWFRIESTLSGDNYVFLTKLALPRPKREMIKLLENKKKIPSK